MKWWFEASLPASSEKHEKSGFKIKKIIYRGKSAYQKIEIFDTVGYGKLLALDGIVQLSERDEFIYHEMLVHPALLTHPDPKKVLIIGGGDGGALREVLKHSVKEAYLVEIDRKVIELSKRYLPFTARGFRDPRVKVFIQDGKEFLKKILKKGNKFDVIILDSTDPAGPAKGLFSARFFKKTYKALGPFGVLVVQSGCWFDQQRHIKNTWKRLKKVFPFVVLYRATVPSFNCEYCFQLASKRRPPSQSELKKRFKIKNLKYYSPEIHFASSVIPLCLKC